VHASWHARPARQRQAPSDVRGAPAARAQVGLVAADRMYGAKRDIVQALGLDIVQVGARPPAPRAAASVCRAPGCGNPSRSAEGPLGRTRSRAGQRVPPPLSPSLLGSL